MNQHHLPDGLFHEVWQLYEGAHSTEEITNRLKKRDLSDETIEEVCRKVRYMRFAKRRRIGLSLCIVGGASLFLAFLTTYILHQMNINTDFALYGLTSWGVLCLFAGMVMYMG
jgi:hypothetical protein